MAHDWITDALDPKNDGKFSDKAKRAKMTTGKIVNVSSKTVQRARSYVKAIKKNPEKYKGKKNTPAQTKLLRQAVMAKTLIEKVKK